MCIALLALRWTYQSMIAVIVVRRFIRWFAFVFLVISFFPSASLGRSRFASLWFIDEDEMPRLYAYVHPTRFTEPLGSPPDHLVQN